ncbi:DUF3307 domain-containing protein [Anaerolineales bacterium HSG6]|nr:DUF3307 domain-containing protein [Anaerolineales bacterium HSG6]MDM8532316.1 DUF3307 domain-containing protein [Anaerolineales bacterium HSG25]
MHEDMALSFFLLLTLGHLIGDFTLQPFWLVLEKRKGWRGLVIHVGIVTFFTAILVWGLIPHWWVWIIVLFLGHLFIDQFRTFVFTDNKKGKGLLLLALDQLAHIVLIWIIAWLALGSPFNHLYLLTTNNYYQLLMYLIGLAALIGVIPVLEVEITVAVWEAQGQTMDKIVAITSADRLLGGLERSTAMLLIALGLSNGLAFLAPLVFVPRLGLMIRRGELKADRTAVTTKVVTSFSAAVLVGMMLYNVPAPTILS